MDAEKFEVLFEFLVDALREDRSRESIKTLIDSTKAQGLNEEQERDVIKALQIFGLEDLY